MDLLIPIAAAYVGLGLLFGAFFAFKGAALLDPVAEGAPLGFRIILLPGAAALWPVLGLKLLRRKEGTS